MIFSWLLRLTKINIYDIIKKVLKTNAFKIHDFWLKITLNYTPVDFNWWVIIQYTCYCYWAGNCILWIYKCIITTGQGNLICFDWWGSWIMVTVICSSEQICRKIISVYQYKVPLKYSTGDFAFTSSLFSIWL